MAADPVGVYPERQVVGLRRLVDRPIALPAERLAAAGRQHDLREAVIARADGTSRAVGLKIESLHNI